MSRRDQGLARDTWLLVEQVCAEADIRERGEFRSRAMGLGPMLRTSGLAATAAFLAAKASGTGSLPAAYRRMAEALAGHVLASIGNEQEAMDRNGFVLWLGRADPATYRQAGAAAREFGLWVRRAAEALIPDAAAAGGGR